MSCHAQTPSSRSSYVFLGVSVQCTRRRRRWVLSQPLRALSLGGLICMICLIVVVHRTLNLMPGVFGLQQPLGDVESGYEYLWGPVVLACLMGWSYSGTIDGRSDPETRTWTMTYGSATEGNALAITFVLFALLMLTPQVPCVHGQGERRSIRREVGRERVRVAHRRWRSQLAP